MLISLATEQRERLESMLREVSVDVGGDEPMARHTSLKVGGPAEGMFFPRQAEVLQKVLRSAKTVKASPFLLGGGTNLLVKDGGIGGVGNKQNRFNQVKEGGGGVFGGGGGTRCTGS